MPGQSGDPAWKWGDAQIPGPAVGHRITCEEGCVRGCWDCRVLAPSGWDLSTFYPGSGWLSIPAARGPASPAPSIRSQRNRKAWRWRWCGRREETRDLRLARCETRLGLAWDLEGAWMQDCCCILSDAEDSYNVKLWTVGKMPACFDSCVSRLHTANASRQPELPSLEKPIPALLFLITTLRSRFNTGPS